MKRIGILALTLIITAAALLPGGRAQRAIAAPFGAATNMTPYNVTCNSVSLQWNPSGYGQQQWVDLSHWNGYYWQWDEGGPLSGYANSFQWNSLIPGTTYYVRIDTGTWDGYWLASDWVRFDTPNCMMPIPMPMPGASRCGGPRITQVCVNRGNGGLYTPGDTVTICYDVSAPGTYIAVQTRLPNGAVNSVFAGGYDDGTGDCASGTAGSAPGRRDVYMYNQYGQVVSSTYYMVVIY